MYNVSYSFFILYKTRIL